MRVKAVALAVLALVMISSVSAVPDLEVKPSHVDRTGNQSLYAGQVNRVNLTFINNDTDEKIYDVSPESSGLKYDQRINFSENSFNISANSSKTIQALIYTESPTSFEDSIDVFYSYNSSNSSGLETNRSKFPKVNFSIETVYQDTNISLKVLDKNFTAQFGETVQSTFDVKNIGNETAYYVDVAGRDVNFSKDGFNVSADDHQLVDFSVKIPLPDSNRTNKTNQTYTRIVNVTGRNFEKESFKVKVFVPYKDYDITAEEKRRELIKALRELQEFCSEEGNSNLPLCGGNIVKYRNNTKIVNNTPVYEANLTKEQLQEIGNISDTYAKRIKNLKQRTNVLQQNIREMRKAVNSELNSLNKTERERYNRILNTLEKRNELINQTKQVRQERLAFNKTVFFGAVFISLMTLTGVGLVKGYQKIQGDELEEFIE